MSVEPTYPSTPPRAKDELPLTGPGAAGSIGARAAARILDTLVVTLPFAAFTIDIDARKQLVIPTWLAIAVLVAPIVYDIVCISAFGMTVGKRVMGLRVVRYIDGGRVLPYQAAIRASAPELPAFVAIAVPALGILGYLVWLIYLSAAFDPVLRGLHDKAAGTIVVRTR